MTQHTELQAANIDAEVCTLKLLLAEREARLTEKDILIAELRSALHHERRSSKGWKPVLAALGLNIAASVLLSLYSLTFQYEMAQSPYLLGAAMACIIFGITAIVILFFPARGIVQDWLEAKRTSALAKYAHQGSLFLCAAICAIFFLHNPPQALGVFCFGAIGATYNMVMLRRVAVASVGKSVSAKQILTLLRRDYQQVDITQRMPQ